jgi:hypothetical protein
MPQYLLHVIFTGINISVVMAPSSRSRDGTAGGGGELKWYDVPLKEAQFLFPLYRCPLNPKQEMDTLCTTDRLCVCGALSRDQHIFQFITKN